jgi:hypothetical protein
MFIGPSNLDPAPEAPATNTPLDVLVVAMTEAGFGAAICAPPEALGLLRIGQSVTSQLSVRATMDGPAIVGRVVGRADRAESPRSVSVTAED